MKGASTHCRPIALSFLYGPFGRGTSVCVYHYLLELHNPQGKKEMVTIHNYYCSTITRVQKKTFIGA